MLESADTKYVLSEQSRAMKELSARQKKEGISFPTKVAPLSSRAAQPNFVARETDGKRLDRAGLTRNALGHTSDETFSIRNVVRRSRGLLDEPRGAQVQHSAIRAADANLVAVAGDGAHRAGRAEEGDRPLVSNIGFTMVMMHEHEVILRRDQEPSDALLRVCGQGQLLAGYLVLGSARARVPDYACAVLGARHKGVGVAELHLLDGTAAQVCEKIVSVYDESASGCSWA